MNSRYTTCADGGVPCREAGPNKPIAENMNDADLLKAIPFTIIYGNLKYTIDEIAGALQQKLPRSWRRQPRGPFTRAEDMRSKAERVIAIYMQVFLIC